MDQWENAQRLQLDNALAEYYRHMVAAKHANISDQRANLNICAFIKENYGVDMSHGWLATVYYGGSVKLWGSRWHKVQAFIAAMHDPRLTGHVTLKTPSLLYRV